MLDTNQGASKRPTFKQVLIPKGSAPTSDGVALFLSLLLKKTACREEYREWGLLVSIHSDLLKQVVGRDYSLVIESAIKAGLVERNDSYSTGGDLSPQGAFTKSYRLTDNLRKADFEWYELKRARPGKSRVTTTDQVGRKLAEMMEDVGMTDPDLLTSWDKILWNSIQSGEFYANRCEYGRFHSSFTGLSKVARKRLVLKSTGEILVEIDVSCCQPLLLWAKAAEGMTAEERSGFEPEYRSLCEHGELYSFLTSELLVMCKREGLSHEDFMECRENIKGELIRMFFQKQSGMQRNQLTSVVYDRFPGIVDYAWSAKAFDHKDLSRELQRMESRIMIDGVCSQLVEDHPEIVLVTVHDSILCTPSCFEAVELEIIHQFRKLGVKPFLKTNNEQYRCHQ
ncbi:MAG: hypothetical protein DWH91_01090 [Planctomycetota bacterium]|nr:MAG: hypothetical protein DWH91_01090 [Planctomycetota bacterium]